MKDGAKNYIYTEDEKCLISLQRLLSKKNPNFPKYKKRYDSLYVIWYIEKDMTNYYVISLLRNCINVYWPRLLATY